MRLDKFLKVSRVIKRRTLAKEICDRGQVVVNGRTAKAGVDIKPGDIIGINFGSRKVVLEVVSVKDNVPAKLAAELYRMIEDIAT